MIERPIDLSYAHRVLFTQDAFAAENLDVVELLRLGRGDGGGAAEPSKVLVFVDGDVAEANPGLLPQIESYAAAHPDDIVMVGKPVLVAGGEACKNDFARVEEAWAAIHEAGIDRHSYIFAIGGGAHLDLIGFAAATAHRGVRHIRFPTTSLSQGDGGVGVKNGVNYFGKKNWVGSFAVPFAVINDAAFLSTLPERALRDGIIEGIKVALIRDREFYEQIEAEAELLAALDPGAIEGLVRRSAELHVEHIATSGDPFELGSARPLDFGHWAAHKLEAITDFRVSHGEAVAIGMALDLIYSAEIGVLERGAAEQIVSLIERVGFTTFAEELADEAPGSGGKPTVLAGLEEFREHLGGELTITLVPAIGEKIEVHEMDEDAVLRAIEVLRARAAVAGC